MKHVPGYLMPGHKKGIRSIGRAEHVGFHKRPRPKQQHDEKGSSKPGKGKGFSGSGKVRGDRSVYSATLAKL